MHTAASYKITSINKFRNARERFARFDVAAYFLPTERRGYLSQINSKNIIPLTLLKQSDSPFVHSSRGRVF